VLAGFVLEADPAAGGRPRLSISGHVVSFHAATAASSRSAARRLGICGVNPSRCISRVTPEPLQETWNSRPISFATRAPVHT
jgi:hypothetical protein